MLSAAIGLSGLVYVWAADRKHQMLVYILKPGTMALIIALAVSGLRSGGAGPYGVAVIAGLAASVAGDVFLMLPQDRFVPGLAAFLVAHLCYIYALWAGTGARLGWWDALTAAVLAAVAVPVVRRLTAALREHGQTKLIAPVVVYATVISVMVWRALGLVWAPAVAGGPVPVVVVGAVLFYVSDTVLAWGRFVRAYRWTGAVVMATYFAAQYCFAWSVGGKG